MTISSIGVGSGLDVNSIVSQLVAIEKQPLQTLATKASSYQTQLSVYGNLNSQVSALEDAAAALATASGWATQKATSSDATAVSVTAGTSAVATSMSVEVTQLARAQSAASLRVASTALGATGDLKFELGSWSDPTVLPITPKPVFTPNVTPPILVTVAATDTLNDIKDKINLKDAGFTATVLNDGTGQRLVIRSTATGKDAGFRLDTPAEPGLAALGFTNPDSVGFVGQAPLDANVKINGVAVTSASNNMVDVTPGVTLKLNKLGSADITIEQDKDAIQTKVQAFADAYSALSKTLADSTKYVAGGTSGPLQGDSTTLGIQTLLRNTLFATSGTGDTAPRLSDIGLELQKDGSLKLNTTKLTTKMSDMTNLQKLFTQANTGQSDNGFGIKFKTFAHNLLNASSGSSALSSGTLVDKKNAIQGSINRNLDDQDRVNARASMVEAALRKQYSALDVQMSKMSALGSYVTAQLAQWNKTA